MPTLSTGQAGNLKVESEDTEGRYWVWLSRCGMVTVERFDGERWYDAQTYPG